ncbi:MAG: DNA alkylation repair protein [Clostridia bacterium]|nr:DNA alkylation repair protein [Clostridia bacterium]
MNMIREKLLEMQDVPYRDFMKKLIPTVDESAVIGIRTPELKRLAKTIAGTEDAKTFMNDLPHKYFEENNLHAYLINNIRDIGACLFETEKFLPYVDNWATCDGLRPAVFKKHPEKLLPRIRGWMESEQSYTVRFGIEMLLMHFLDDHFQPEYLEWVAGIRSEEYYVNMMIAWYFAEALAKQYDAVIPFIESNRLGAWPHNKAIQKAVESFRISDERKAWLKSLRKK